MAKGVFCCGLIATAGIAHNGLAPHNPPNTARSSLCVLSAQRWAMIAKQARRALVNLAATARAAYFLRLFAASVRNAAHHAAAKNRANLLPHKQFQNLRD